MSTKISAQKTEVKMVKARSYRASEHALEIAGRRLEIQAKAILLAEEVQKMITDQVETWREIREHCGLAVAYVEHTFLREKCLYAQTTGFWPLTGVSDGFGTTVCYIDLNRGELVGLSKSARPENWRVLALLPDLEWMNAEKIINQIRRAVHRVGAHSELPARTNKPATALIAKSRRIKKLAKNSQ